MTVVPPQPRQLGSDLLDARTSSEVVDVLVRLASMSADTACVGVTLVHPRGRRFETAGSTDPRVLGADALQYELREGPCVESATRAEVVTAARLGNDARWPRWGPRAATMGLQSAVSVPLHARGRRYGSLNLYADQPCGFDAEEVETARLLAERGSLALALARAEEGMAAAIDSRTLIGQAQGILMERFSLSADQTFAVLQRYSQHGNIRLRDVCRGIVDTRQLPDASLTSDDVAH